MGSEKFQNDAREVMDMLLKTHGDGVDLPDDDPQTSYMISAWSRICKVYLNDILHRNNVLLSFFLGFRKKFRTLFTTCNGTRYENSINETRYCTFG